MLHSNPFSQTGHDLHALKLEIERKANEYEVSALRGNVDSLARSLRDACAEIDVLRNRIYETEARLLSAEQRLDAEGSR